VLTQRVKTKDAASKWGRLHSSGDCLGSGERKTVRIFRLIYCAPLLIWPVNSLVILGIQGIALDARMQHCSWPKFGLIVPFSWSFG
jgi:hypothetical protein